MSKIWQSLTFSFKLKISRLTITIRFEPSANAEKQQATVET